MTESIAQLVKIEKDKIEPIPNADNIGLVTIGGYQVVVRKKDFENVDKGLFVSVDSVLPDDFLDAYNLREMISKGRIKTKRLRGIYSQGLIVPVTEWKKEVLESANIGDNIAPQLEIKKYEPPLPPFMHGGGAIEAVPWPSGAFQVYDIDSMQNPMYRDVFSPDDEVVVTEKIHGSNVNFAYINGDFHVTSRRVSMKDPELTGQQQKSRNPYWMVAKKYHIENIIKQISIMWEGADIVIRGELYGKGIQFLQYGLQEPDLLVFDVEIGLGRFIPEDYMRSMMNDYFIPTVPKLYQGKFDMKKMEELAEQTSTVCAGQMQEGIVIKDVNINNRNVKIGRKILKMIGKKYAMKSAEEWEHKDA